MGKRVMIIEDNISTLMLLSDMVKSVSDDAEIKEFLSMEGTYETAVVSTIDLFLVDIIVDKDIQADTSGIRFVDRIRKIQRYEFTPVIFITSLEDPKLYAYSELHSFSYIEKPFDYDYVKNIISMALRFPDLKKSESTLFFRKEGILFSVKSSEILYIESIRHKMYVYRINGDVMIIPYRTCRKIIEESDDDNLIQCSRNTIINRKYVDNIDFTNRYIKMKGIEKLIDIGITYQRKISREFGNDL